MNEQKARKQRRIEMAHDRFAGILLAVGMPERGITFRSGGRAKRIEDYNWYSNEYRERVGNFYIASFTSAPRPNAKTVKKFVRSYMRWLAQQHNQRRAKWNPPEI